MRKLIIIQPSIGGYRIGFYKSLYDRLHGLFIIKVFTSLTDSNKVYSVKKLHTGIIYKNTIPTYSYFKNSLFFQPIFSLIRDLNSNDIFLINGNPRYLSNLIFCIYAKLCGAKIIWWGHGLTAGGGHLNLKIRLFIMGFFDYVFLYTDHEVERYRERISTNVSALNNGVDVHEIRSYLPLFVSNTQSYRIGFIGRLEDKSNLNVLLMALSYLKSKNYEVYSRLSVEVIGGGSLYKSYVSLSNNLGLQDKVSWYGEIWDSAISNNILHKCAFFCYPGTVGLSVVHAFAIGLPVVVHNNRSNQMPEIDYVREGINGLFFKENDHIDLARVIASLLTNRDSLYIMRNSAYKTVENNFNTDNMAKRFSEKILTLYDD